MTAMNDTFNFSRFGKVFTYELKNYTPSYLKALILINAVPVAMWIISLLFGADVGPAGRLGVFSTLSYIAILCAPFIIYKYINDRKKGYSYAMQPASIAEKMVSMFIMRIVIVPIVTFLSMFIMDNLLLGLSALGIGNFHGYIFSSMGWIKDLFSIALSSTEEIGIAGDISFSRLMLTQIIGFLGYITGAIMFNSIFRTHKIAKTILTLITIGFVFSMIAGVAAISWVTHIEDTGYIATESLHWSTNPVWVILVGAIQLIVYTTITYFRLKKVNY